MINCKYLVKYKEYLNKFKIYAPNSIVIPNIYKSSDDAKRFPYENLLGLNFWH